MVLKQKIEPIFNAILLIREDIEELGKPELTKKFEEEKRETYLLFKLVPSGDIERDAKALAETIEKYKLKSDEFPHPAIVLFTEESLCNKLIETGVLERERKLFVHTAKTNINVMPILTDFSNSEKVGETEEALNRILRGFAEAGSYNYIEVHCVNGEAIEVKKGVY